MENMELTAAFKDKKVFLTGHTGFKGGWLLMLLEELGAKIYGYALAPKENSIFNVLKIGALHSSIYADVLDYNNLKEEIVKVEPEIIIHLAAQSLVIDSYNDPIRTFEVNTIGTANVLQAVQELDKPCAVIIVTTDKVYSNNNQKQQFSEDDPLGGNDPYSASKAAAEIVVQSFRHSFFNPKNYDIHKVSIASARSGNVIGGGDWSENRIVPDIVRAISKKNIIRLRNPNSTRPWQHVLEPLAGYLHLAYYMIKYPDSDLYNSSWNFGPMDKDQYSVNDLALEIINVWQDGQMEETHNSEVYEASFLEINSAKSSQYLNWQPRLSFKESIQFTISWYREFLNGSANMNEITKRQVREYLDYI